MSSSTVSCDFWMGKPKVAAPGRTVERKRQPAGRSDILPNCSSRRNHHGISRGSSNLAEGTRAFDQPEMRRNSFSFVWLHRYPCDQPSRGCRETLYFLATDAASIERSVGTKHAKSAGLIEARCCIIYLPYERGYAIDGTRRRRPEGSDAKRYPIQPRVQPDS